MMSAIRWKAENEEEEAHVGRTEAETSDGAISGVARERYFVSDGRLDESMSKQAEVTELLLELSGGDRDALDRLVPLVYEELRRIGRRQLYGEAPGHTLSTTALVHETFLRLVDLNRIDWKNRAHFFALSARLMRQILVNHAEGRRAQKRGGGLSPLSLDEDVDHPVDQLSGKNGLEVEIVLALDGALKRLEHLDQRQSQVVEYRFFAGLGIEETAEVLGVSAATVKRDWVLARAWLNRELSR